MWGLRSHTLAWNISTWISHPRPLRCNHHHIYLFRIRSHPNKQTVTFLHLPHFAGEIRGEIPKNPQSPAQPSVEKKPKSLAASRYRHPSRAPWQTSVHPATPPSAKVSHQSAVLENSRGPWQVYSRVIGEMSRLQNEWILWKKYEK